MRVRLSLIGKGTPADPIRAPLPTYSMIDSDQATILVDVPSDDVPPPVQSAHLTESPVTESWIGYLVTRYPHTDLSGLKVKGHA
jgi:hypothetical protein